MNVATVPTEPTQVARSPTTSLVMSSDTSLGGRHRLVEPERRWCIHLRRSPWSRPGSTGSGRPPAGRVTPPTERLPARRPAPFPSARHADGRGRRPWTAGLNGLAPSACVRARCALFASYLCAPIQSWDLRRREVETKFPARRRLGLGPSLRETGGSQGVVSAIQRLDAEVAPLRHHPPASVRVLTLPDVRILEGARTALLFTADPRRALGTGIPGPRMSTGPRHVVTHGCLLQRFDPARGEQTCPPHGGARCVRRPGPRSHGDRGGQIR
jgi:hypothetical protein